VNNKISVQVRPRCYGDAIHRLVNCAYPNHCPHDLACKRSTVKRLHLWGLNVQEAIRQREQASTMFGEFDVPETL